MTLAVLWWMYCDKRNLPKSTACLHKKISIVFFLVLPCLFPQILWPGWQALVNIVSGAILLLRKTTISLARPQSPVSFGSQGQLTKVKWMVTVLSRMLLQYTTINILVGQWRFTWLPVWLGLLCRMMIINGLADEVVSLLLYKK